MSARPGYRISLSPWPPAVPPASFPGPPPSQGPTCGLPLPCRRLDSAKLSSWNLVCQGSLMGQWSMWEVEAWGLHVPFVMLRKKRRFPGDSRRGSSGTAKARTW